MAKQPTVVKSRVFVVGPSGSHDFKPAEAHGQLVRVLDRPVNPFRTDDAIAALLEELNRQNFNSSDYLIMGGSSLLNAVVAAWVVKRFGRLRLLIYGAKNHDYVPRDIDLSRFMTDEEHQDEQENIGNRK